MQWISLKAIDKRQNDLVKWCLGVLIGSKKICERRNNVDRNPYA